MAIIDRRGVVVSGTDPAQASDPNPGLAIKAAVAVATASVNIVLAGLQTIDGYAVQTGDRVLVKDQADQTTNGIYAASTGNWARTTDADGNTDFAPGLQVGVINGAANGGKTFKLTTPSPVVLGTSLITWQVVNYPKSGMVFGFTGGSGGTLLVNQDFMLEVPFGCTIVSADIFADRASNLVVDLQRTTKANYPDGWASLCNGTPPTLANAQKALNTTLAGWTLLLNEDDLVKAVVLSNDVATEATVALKVSRS